MIVPLGVIRPIAQVAPAPCTVPRSQPSVGEPEVAVGARRRSRNGEVACYVGVASAGAELGDRAARGDPPDRRVAGGVGEPEIAVGARRDIVRHRLGFVEAGEELGDRAARRDPPDRALHDARYM